jgi:hypothetical protein
MKTKIENKINKRLYTLLNIDIITEFRIENEKFHCLIKNEKNQGIHYLSGEITEMGLYLKHGHTSSLYRRLGIAQSVREAIHSVLKQDYNQAVYTNSREFIDPSKTLDGVSPLYELWEKLVSRGIAKKNNDDYIMI